VLIFIIKANVLPGQVEVLQRQMEETTARINQNEPGYALYLHFNPDQTIVTFVNLATDTDALANHFAEASKYPEASQRLFSSIQIVSVNVYGNLTPEAEALLRPIVSPINLEYIAPQSGTFDRLIS